MKTQIRRRKRSSFLSLTALVVITVIALSISACSKENAKLNSSSQKKTAGDYLPDINSCFTGVIQLNGYLKFNSQFDLQQVIDCLEMKTNDMETSFLNDWDDLNDSLINEKEIEIGYNQNMVYEAFEDHFAHLSLRKKLEQDEENWLNMVPFDTSSAAIPDHVVGDDVFQTILSEDGVFILADTIYLINPTGDYYRILNGDFLILDSLLQGNWSGSNVNVEYYINDNVSGKVSSGGTCRGRGCTKWKWKYNSGKSYGMCYKAGFYNFQPRTVYYAKAKSYRKRGSRYGRYRMNITLKAHGEYKDPDPWSSTAPCDESPISYSRSGTRRKTSHCEGRTMWFARFIWEDCAHKGQHSTSKVSQVNTTVNW